MRQSTREFVEKQVEKFQERFEVDYDAYPSIPRGALIAGLAKVNQKVIYESKRAHGEVAIREVVDDIEQFCDEDEAPQPQRGNKRRRDTSAFQNRRNSVDALKESLRLMRAQSEKYKRILRLARDYKNEVEQLPDEQTLCQQLQEIDQIAERLGAKIKHPAVDAGVKRRRLEISQGNPERELLDPAHQFVLDYFKQVNSNSTTTTTNTSTNTNTRTKTKTKTKTNTDTNINTNANAVAATKTPTPKGKEKPRS